MLGFAAYGFAWWEALPVLRERYWDGIAADRPAAYWTWGNLAALVVCAGPLLGPGLAMLRRGADRVVLLLVAAAVACVVLADLSQMSRAEVGGSGSPFVPWLLLSTALLPERWRRWGCCSRSAGPSRCSSCSLIRPGDGQIETSVGRIETSRSCGGGEGLGWNDGTLDSTSGSNGAWANAGSPSAGGDGGGEAELPRARAPVRATTCRTSPGR